ncbi:hypothetical protein [Bacillus cereus group sp. TH160LC]|uniref:hypothetical protein n=1 Tax=Bacillus cereus group sp. TH160LC TaxID=3018058 RepID=UPI0022DF794C|nr:hypothetical protein [Bacillus cereus group sp. TH160LC]MDA1653037.1 hypothetical protein [Bacillus cereus group sp. TH160LC]
MDAVTELIIANNKVEMLVRHATTIMTKEQTLKLKNLISDDGLKAMIETRISDLYKSN